MKDESKYFKEQMDNIQRRIDGIHDQYNAENNPFDENDYNRLINAEIDFSPKKNESLTSYVARAKIYAEMNAKKNIKTHINGPKGAWFTHRNPYGCFACEDCNLIAVLVRTLQAIELKYPDLKF